MKILGFVTLFLIFTQRALGCASCGSGGDDPLILYPTDNWRFYGAISRSTNFKTIMADGTAGDENGPKNKDAFTLSIGKAINPEAFVTLTVPYLQNSRDGRSRTSFGDPILGGRWTIISQNIAQEWIPQVQWMVSRRFANTRAIQETEDENLLDVFGNGVPETKLGVDIFYGMGAVKGGIAQAFLFSDERRLGAVTIAPGLGIRSVATIGYGISGIGKIQTGIVREWRNKTKQDGALLEDSQSLNHSIFVTLDGEINPTNMLRFTYSRKAAILQNRQTSRADSFIFAYIYTL